MDSDWLAGALDAGRSIEDIARETGKHPSTVAYWMNKHGLVSQHAAKHQARGGVDEDELRELVERGLSMRQVAECLQFSLGATRYWLRKYGLKTRPNHYVPPGADKPTAVFRECRTHGFQRFHRIGSGRYRCGLCNGEQVTQRRREVKAILVAEAGGECAICGYDRYIGALQFHHVDPATKEFNLGFQGVPRALEQCRAEARKCVLLCANCHAEVEAGVAQLPFPRNDPGHSPG